MRRAGLIFLLVIVAAALALGSGLIRIPPDYNPWATLDLTAAPNWLTRYKLYRLKRDPALCREALRQTDIEFRPLEDRPGGECPLLNVIQVSKAGVAFNHNFTASCGLAAAWEIFRHNTLQAAAQRHFGQPVTRVEHVGTFACRNIYNRAEGRLSEHARANAIDITAFVLADGTRISVEKDWKNTRQPEKAAFLREIQQGACRAFNVVFGPGHNAAHANHFHLDMGGFLACR